MALNRMTIDGYGQVELNQVAFRRDGRIEAQCKLDATDFASIPAENGMILAVDNVARTVGLPATGDKLFALNYSAEVYHDDPRGLKNFKTERGEFLPRLGYLAVGDKFTTNTIAYDTTEFTTNDALVTALKAYATTPVYGGVCANGAIQATATAPQTGPVLKVIKSWTMPDGQYGVQFQVISA